MVLSKMQFQISLFVLGGTRFLSLWQLNETLKTNNKTKKGITAMKTFTISTWIKLAIWIVLLVIQLCSVHAQYSQQWVSTLNSPGNKTSVLKDASDNLYTFGGNKLAKFNSAGAQLWSASTDNITAMALDNSGNIYVTGGYGTVPYGYIFVKKFSNSGTEVMSKISGGGMNYIYTPVDITIDNSGSIYVYSSLFVTGTYHSGSCRLFKFDNAGNDVWNINPSGISPVRMIPDNSGNLLMISHTYSYYGYFPTYTTVSRCSPSGSILNSLTIDSTGSRDIFVASSGHIYLTGDRTIKINPAFSVEWEVINNFYGASVKSDNSGNVFVTGNTSYSYVSNIVTQKLSASGQVMWSQNYDGPVNGEDVVTDMLLTPNGSVLIGGTTEINTGNLDMFLIRYSSTGGFMNSNSYNDMTDDEGKKLILINGNDVVLCGLSGDGYSFDKAVLIKFSDVTAITPQNSQVPGGFSLKQNYPNPFNPNTKIGFRIAKATFVKMAVYDITGKEVEVLVNENLSAGSFEVDFNASKLTSGVYFCKISAGEFSDVKKMILAK